MSACSLEVRGLEEALRKSDQTVPSPVPGPVAPATVGGPAPTAGPPATAPSPDDVPTTAPAPTTPTTAPPARDDQAAAYSAEREGAVTRSGARRMHTRATYHTADRLPSTADGLPQWMVDAFAAGPPAWAQVAADNQADVRSADAAGGKAMTLALAVALASLVAVFADASAAAGRRHRWLLSVARVSLAGTLLLVVATVAGP